MSQKLSNLAKVITDQYNFMNGTQTSSELYNEIVLATSDYKSLHLGTILDTKVKNPTKVFRSANFQYFIEGDTLIITNKYFN